MALLKILVFPDPRLRTLAEPIMDFDDSLKKLSEDMLETMYEGSGIGLAATQVNVHKRIIVVDISEEKNSPLILVNPTLKKIINPEKKSYSEGCLSVPGFYEELLRPSSVEINASSVNGDEVNIVTEGLLSVVIQHEMDHLDGKMMVDFISNIKREMIRKKLLKSKA
ncbi:MAG: peptide deformylase [SAR86 cluster bacterium]|nr:peptide deformylase [SAR86 cluster bacterium]|tara:strand:- start:241 stop:741 length:501 start_codon:yes stop_codon:yes gene_type:complete